MCGFVDRRPRPDIGRRPLLPTASRARLDRLWSALWLFASPRRLLLAGIPAMLLFMLLTALNAGGQVVLWENAHWTVAGLLATAVATSAAYRSTGLDRRLRTLLAVGAASWLIGQLCWIAQPHRRISACPHHRTSGSCSL